MAQRRIETPRIGFGGVYKLGCWAPLQVELHGGTEPVSGLLQVTVPDGDGVPTTVVTPAPIHLQPEAPTPAELLVRVGQPNASLTAKFLPAEAKTPIARTFHAGPEPGDGLIPGAIPATNRLLVTLGPSLGLADLLANDSTDELSRTRLVSLESVAELPTRWEAYEGVDQLVLSTSAPDFYAPLRDNPDRIRALREWIEMGGKLVIVCGSQAEQLLGPDGPLRDLIPGTFAGMVELDQASALETYSGSEQAITPDRRVRFSVPLLDDIRGRREAVARRGSQELPLVYRSYLGFGELTFVALDFDLSPLREWPGRLGFLRRALAWKETRGVAEQSTETTQLSSEDLITRVLTVLDESFSSVHVIPFALVALLVLLYLLLIGPGDYFLVTRLLKRPEWTWLTFPLIVAASSAGAYWYAHSQKGDQLRVNQVEIVDLDATTGTLRGTTWTHLFSPAVQQFDLAFRPAYLGQPLADSTPRIVAWLGLPGFALGGMQSTSGQTGSSTRDTAFPRRSMRSSNSPYNSGRPRRSLLAGAAKPPHPWKLHSPGPTNNSSPAPSPTRQSTPSKTAFCCTASGPGI